MVWREGRWPMNRMIIVSNRLPITVERRDGKFHVVPSSGGLVTALRPIVSSRRSVWIGWPGRGESREELQRSVSAVSTPRLTLAPVFLTEKETKDYYIGFANE